MDYVGALAGHGTVEDEREKGRKGRKGWSGFDRSDALRSVDGWKAGCGNVRPPGHSGGCGTERGTEMSGSGDNGDVGREQRRRVGYGGREARRGEGAKEGRRGRSDAVGG